MQLMTNYEVNQQRKTKQWMYCNTGEVSHSKAPSYHLPKNPRKLPFSEDSLKGKGIYMKEC